MLIKNLAIFIFYTTIEYFFCFCFYYDCKIGGGVVICNWLYKTAYTTPINNHKYMQLHLYQHRPLQSLKIFFYTRGYKHLAQSNETKNSRMMYRYYYYMTLMLPLTWKLFYFSFSSALLLFLKRLKMFKAIFDDFLATN